MKNSFLINFFLTIFLLTFLHAKANEDFIFKSKSIEIIDSGKKIIGKNGVIITTPDDKILITSKNSEYIRKNKILNLINDVKIVDRELSLEIEGDFATYFKENEKIIAKENVKIKKNTDEIEIYSDNAIFYKIKKELELKQNIIVKDRINKIELKSDHVLYSNDENKIKSLDTTLIKLNKNYTITGKDIIYFRDKNLVTSVRETFVTDNKKNKLKLSGFKYDLLSKKLITEALEFSDQEKNIYKTTNAIISLNNDKLAAKDIQIYFNDLEFGSGSRLKGKSVISENNKTIVKKGIFTSCEVRDDDKCPPWSIKSDVITHDKIKKTIYYDNSILEIYDYPVFYFPKFFHPDPSVKRQSGFLAPSTINSSSLGSSLILPYYKVISENKDYTFSPRFFTNNNLLLQNEYRQVQKNTDHISDFSLKFLDKGTKGHFFTNTKKTFDLDSKFSEFEFNFEKTNNDTYLKKNKITVDTKDEINRSLLNSFIKFNAIDEDYDFFGEIGVYEDLTKKNNSDKFQYILPNFTFSKILKSDLNLNGVLNYKINGSSTQKDTNVKESYIINDLFYNSDLYFSRFGSTSKFNLEYKNTLKKGKNSTIYPDESEINNYTLLSINSSVPLIKKHSNYVSNLIPKITAKFNPDKSEKNQNLNRRISMTNIFSNNRLGVNDSFEGGNSLTIGFEYDLNMKNNKNDILGFGLAQIFRDAEDKRLPKKSKMQSKSSDVVGDITFKPNDLFKFKYDFSADNSLDTVNYSKIDTELSINNFITSFEFLEENNEIGSDSYLSSKFKYLFNKNSNLVYNTRRNRKTNLTEYYNLIYEYKNDCLVAAIEYNKDYYKDRDIEPSEEIFFKITFTPLTTFNSPNLK